MKVLMFSSECPPLQLGGLGTHVGLLAAGVAAVLEQVRVYVYLSESDRSYKIGRATIRVSGVQEPEFPIGNVGELHLISRVTAQAALEDIRLSGVRPDIVQCHEWSTFKAAEIVGRTLNIPVVATVHLNVSSVALFGESPMAFALLEEKRMCKSADAVIAVSGAVKQMLCADHVVEPGKVHVVHNGAPLPKKGENGENRTSKELLAAAEWDQDGSPLVMFAGRFSVQKGIEEFLRAAALLICDHPATRFVLAGDLRGTSAQRLSELADRFIRVHPLLHRNVRFLGKLNAVQLHDWYETCDIAVVPSVYEPFGYAAIEAMLHKLPVVASACGGLTEVIQDGVTGLLVPMVSKSYERQGCDVQQLAQAQRRLIESPELRRNLGEAAFQRARQDYSLKQMVEKTIRVYEEACRVQVRVIPRGLAM